MLTECSFTDRCPTQMNWTKPGEVPRECDVSALGRRVAEGQAATVADVERWMMEAANERDWYRVERLAKRLQKEDRSRAFDYIDLFNKKAL